MIDAAVRYRAAARRFRNYFRSKNDAGKESVAIDATKVRRRTSTVAAPSFH
jgi:hypothetical protein